MVFRNRLLRCQQKRTRSIVNTRGISCRHGPVRFYDWPELGQYIEGRIGPRMLIRLKHFRFAFLLWCWDRNDFTPKEPGLLCGSPAVLAPKRKGVLILSTDIKLFRDVLPCFRH